MACTIPGCGSTKHNRRTHFKHHPVQGEALIEQPGTGEPVAPTGADIAREALRERRNIPGVTVSFFAVQPNDDGSVDAAQVQDQPEVDLPPEVTGEWPDDLYRETEVYDDRADDEPEPRITPPWRTVLGPDEPIVIREPGVYELTAEEYHSVEATGDWVSNSDLRAMSAPHCPAKWRYNRDNGVKVISDAFSFGHAWHSRVLGKGEEIAVRPAEFDSWRTNAAKAWRSEQEAAGRSVILPEDWEAVEAMAAAVYEREEAARLLAQPGRPELAMFWVDPATGVKRRALVDYMPDRPNANGVLEIVDIKSTDSASPDDDLERKIYKYGYFRQAVTIMDGAIALGLAEDATVFFIFQEKTAPYLVQEVELDAQAQLAGSIENHRALMVYKQCLETGVWPSYSPGTVTLSLPPYILARYEDEIEVSH